MRVAVIGCNHMTGGTRTAYREFVSMLVEHGFDTAAVSIADGPEWIPEGLNFHHRVSFSRRGLGLSKAIEALHAVRRCKNFGPDVFVSVGLTRVGDMISRNLGKKTFRICQDVIFGRDPGESSLVRARRSFDAIAPQAPRMAMELRRRGFTDGSMKWLPCFAERPVAGIRANPGSRHPFRLAYFGRLAPHKGLDLLIQALAIKQLSDDLRLDIWGPGDVEPYRGLVARLGVGGYVRINGPYPPARAGAELMASYDALALTTLGNEGLPLILLEAMAYGLPLLTTSVAAIPDCCVGNPDAVMVEPTISGIRAGLELVVTGLKEGSFSASRQQEFYQRRFSYEVMSRRWLDCLADPHGFFRQ